MGVAKSPAAAAMWRVLGSGGQRLFGELLRSPDGHWTGNGVLEVCRWDRRNGREFLEQMAESRRVAFPPAILVQTLCKAPRRWSDRLTA